MGLLIVPQRQANAAGMTAAIRPIEASVTVGQTLHVEVSITNNGPNTIEPFSILCTDTNILIYQQPNFGFFVKPGQTYTQWVSFLAAHTGSESITCQVHATDVVTSAGIVGTSNAIAETVGQSASLGFTAYGSTNRVRVGETAIVTLKYVNRGNTPITINSMGCDVLASPALTLVSGQTPLKTLPSGWSQFIQQTYKGTEIGTSIFACHITATDSAGNPMSLDAPRFTINVVAQ